MILKPSSLMLAGLCCISLLSCNQGPAGKETTGTEAAVQEKVSASPQAGAEEEGNVIGAQPAADTVKGSLKAQASGKIGPATVRVNYHSPAVRERVIWGGLVPYNQVWVTGAHQATSLEVDQPITIGGKQLTAGKYALFTIPGKQEWTVIINKKWDQHLADEYSGKEDLVRLTVKPEKTSQHQERLRYQIESQSEKSGAIVLAWEKIKLAVPVIL
jgi:hypothetical protein